MSGWSGEQIQNAATIYQVGRQMGMSSRDIQIALITAMVESNLVNVHYGDRDSLGLFQQRPSQGWGTPEQVLNPQYAARKFYSSLRGIGNRNNMSMGAAAQAVQRSAYPGRYDQRVGEMRSLWPRIANAAGDVQQSMDGGPYNPTKGQSAPTMQFSTDPLQPQQSVSLGAADTLGAPTQDMLAAWDTGTPQTLDTGQVVTPPRTIISQGTNDAVIKPMAEVSGPYTKGVNGWRKAVVQMARQYVGVPYVWGGEAPNGFDCSGLVQYVFKQAGRNMPRVSYQQATVGKRVGINQLRPGDLVAWDNSTRNNGADHIAIYIGNGQIIEAPRPGLSVRIRSLGSNEGAWGVSLG